MKLFALVYGVGTVVTVFMSNDATAVVLTPAVFAATKAAKVKNPFLYLFICAFVANAASFVLPISNPANLSIFREQMPPLLQWLARFAPPSLLSIAVTTLFSGSRRAMIPDAWSRRVIGYALGRQIDTRLALAALRAAIETRRPPPSCIHHSDRGVQYAAEPYRRVLADHGRSVR